MNVAEVRMKDGELRRERKLSGGLVGRGQLSPSAQSPSVGWERRRRRSVRKVEVEEVVVEEEEEVEEME